MTNISGTKIVTRMLTVKGSVMADEWTSKRRKRKKLEEKKRLGKDNSHVGLQVV